MADPREIARGLTKAQARDLTTLATCDFALAVTWFPHEVPRSGQIAAVVAAALRGKGLAYRKAPAMWAATDLGRAVAAALREAETP